MAQRSNATLDALMAENPQSSFGYALGQLPNKGGVVDANNNLATCQIMLPDILTYRISRSQTLSSDTCTLTFADDKGTRLSTNKAGTLGYLFYPGPIAKTIQVFLGLRGPILSGQSGFQKDAQVALPQFTGFVEADANAQAFSIIDKTVTLNDITSQFRFQVYDTFPHALFGDQTLSYFDPTYNLTPITNPASGTKDGKVWQCDGRMFTDDSDDPVWGSTNMPVLVYVDDTGHTAQGNPLGGVNNYVSPPTFPNTVGNDQNGLFTFDFADGVITFTTLGLGAGHLGHPSGLPLNSAVSVQGNPTYMAPETMIRKLLVEKAGWNPNALDLQDSNLLLPMFDGQDRSIWDCMNAIAAMTSPRFIPWQLWTDESGTIHLYESNLDSPPKRFWINGQGVFTADHEYSARDLRTVVRGDGTVAIAGTGGIDSGSDQSVTSIAYDNKSIVEYGLTEPLLLDQDVTDSVRHLSPTQAVAHLNLIAQSMLYSVSRPTYTITVDHLPDYALQIGDPVHYNDASINVDDYFEVIGIEKSFDGKKATQQTTLQQYVETINVNLGVPSGVSDSETKDGATQAPPNSAIIGSVRMGSSAEYVFQYGDYTRDQYNNPIEAQWNPNAPDNMHFDYMLWSKAKAEGGGGNEWNYNNLPPVTGGTWESEIRQQDGASVWYIPHATGAGGDGYTYYVGPDSVFYRYKNGTDPSMYEGNPVGTDYHIGPFDLTYTWIPPGNRDDGGRQGKGYSAYVWAWWFLCLDSTIQDPATGQFYYNEPFKEKNGRILQRFITGSGTGSFEHTDAAKVVVPDNTSVWVNNAWSAYPGPNGSTNVSKVYKNLAIGLSDYTKVPLGFVGADVMGDGVKQGVAYGADVGNTQLYVNYQKKTKGFFNIYALDSDGGSQMLRIPFLVAV